MENLNRSQNTQVTLNAVYFALWLNLSESDIYNILEKQGAIHRNTTHASEV